MRLQNLVVLLAACLFAFPALANNQQLAYDFCTPIGETISGAVVDIGAACGNSWRGGNQYIQNMQQFSITPPAESDAESSCGLVQGGSDLVFNSNDPVFVGVPGHKGTHVVFDGTNFLAWPDTGSPFNDAMGKTTGFQDFTIAVVMMPVPDGTIQSIIATKGSGCSAGNYRGINLWIDASNHVNFTQCGDVGPASTVTSTVTLQAAQTYYIAVGRSGTTTKLWVGRTTAESFTQNYDPTALAPFGKMVIGSLAGVQSGFLSAGTELFDFQTFNRMLTDTDVGSDITALQLRDGISPLTH